MIALRVDFLTGRSVATAYNARNKPEWPPHPARIFSTLVATWATAEERSDLERAALLWLENAGAPALVASDATERAPVTYYVPDNPASVIDQAALEAVREAVHEVEAKRTGGSRAQRNAERRVEKARERAAAAMAVIREPKAEHLKRARALDLQSRSRQARFFPSVTPEEPTLYFVWNADPSSECFDALQRLAERVVRIGHSSSLVRCNFLRTAPEPNWFPDDEQGDKVLRVAAPGQLERLDSEFAWHRETEPRILPCRFQRYRRGSALSDEKIEEPVFGRDWVVFRRVGGPRFSMTRLVEVARALRGALLKHAGSPAPLLSGHDGNGAPASVPHAAFVPLPFVGHLHADGSILGLAIVLPRSASEDERRSVLRAIARWEDSCRDEEQSDAEAPVVPLFLGKLGTLELERVAWGEPCLFSLRQSTWCRPADTWLSATPVALDRNPGDLRSRDPGKAEAAYAEAARIVARSCEAIGLPPPASVEILPSAAMAGAAKARAYPAFPPEPSKLRRVKVHACVRFARKVRGPVILGAGRYGGLGLFRPIVDEASG